jgi:hypothetical protein
MDGLRLTNALACAVGFAFGRRDDLAGAGNGAAVLHNSCSFLAGGNGGA